MAGDDEGRGCVNPARAGMIRASRYSKTLWFCKPRASGDDPASHDPYSEAYR